MTSLLKFRVNYGGTFYLNKQNELCYRKGKVHSYIDYDIDMLSKVVLENMFVEDIGLSNIREIWFLHPGKKINLGLRLMDSDKCVLECANCVGKDKLMHLYVIQGNEKGPTQIRSPSPPLTKPSCTSIVPYNEAHNEATENPTQTTTPPTHSSIISDIEGSDSESDDEVIGSESSSEGSDFNLTDKDEEDLFEDDNDFEGNVDQQVDDVVGGISVGDAEAEEPCDVDDSDELKSLSDSDGSKRRYPHFNALTDFKKKICFKHGMIFGSNDIFRKALRQYSVENGGDYYYLHNDKRKVYAYCKKRCDCPVVHSRIRCTCKKVLCGFKACARNMASDGSFQLKSWQGKHECGWQHKNTKVTSEWLAERYMENYRDDPHWRLHAFISAVKRDHNVEIGYTQAWKSRLRAMIMTQGDCRAQYGRVYDYALTIQKYNPGSSVFVKVNNDDPQQPVFERIYVCLDACRRGFLEGCRPVIGVDGCHLKGAYSGQVFVAVGKDGNDNIFPIAYAIVEAERKETWLWFIDLLLRDVGSSNPTFISDRQKGLLEALDELAPGAEKRVCVRHLYQNVKPRWPGKAIKDAIWAAARAYNVVDFNIAMEEIKALSVECHKYLVDSDPKTWARHGFGHFSKCDMLLNNICESFNSYILPARVMPVLSMLEWIRRTLMKRLITKKQGMLGYVGKFTPKATKLIQSAREEATRSCTPHWGGGECFEVDHFGHTYIVNLETRSCGCKKWDLSGIPCPHAICCILKDRRNVDDFVDGFYTKDMYLKAYKYCIKAMPGDDQWEKDTQIPPLPPKYIVQPGRPRKRRRREVGEGQPGKKIRISRERKCSQCGQLGHYKNRCNKQTTQASQPKEKGRGGRPAKPNTVPIGSQKRRKYHKKPSGEAVSEATACHIGSTNGGTSEGLSRNAPQQSYSQGGTQVSSMPMTQVACSQTTVVQKTKPSKAMPYKPVRAKKTNVVTSMTQLRTAIRTSPRSKSKTAGGSRYAA